ncbi:MAG: flavin prenyltransferase UbiX [Pseudomonadota bacterium]
MKDKTIIVGISGASGSIYAIRLIKALVQAQTRVMAIVSDAGKEVMAHEMGFDPIMPFSDWLIEYGIPLDAHSKLEVFSQSQMASEPASGSFVHAGMVVCPCSMKTLSAIAHGFADNLLTRSADVSLKEKRPLILVPRETPYNLIHLENMKKAHQAGAVILSPNPSFYSFPKTIEQLVDTVVARILDHLNVTHDLMPRWGA